MDDDFLSLVRNDIPLRARKEVLSATLQGIADMHDRDVVHLDVKPNNILVNHRHMDQEVVIEKVQISDLENAAYLPKPRCIKGMLAGNDNWRSPEGHFKGELNKPSDLYSFGLVCIYAILGRVILGPDDDFKLHESKGALPAFIRLQRQISYFGDKGAEWPDVDSTFKDLIRGLNNLDPSQRLTARQALEHPWFNGIEST
ncbi:hypothetical protein HBI80_070960 [Parastagonospora nodorum]|nr:hypothetical protein HBI80_070960 [Parastagonospora nodorum]